MTLYAESSAVLAWLLGESDGHRVRKLLRRAKSIIACDLVLIECDRVLIRAATLGEINDVTAVDRRSRLNAAAAFWHLLRVSPEIVERARRPFPEESIRTLDAIHLASALTARSVVPNLQLLTLDDRIRRAGAHLGFTIQPT